MYFVYANLRLLYLIYDSWFWSAEIKSLGSFVTGNEHSSAWLASHVRNNAKAVGTNSESLTQKQVQVKFLKRHQQCCLFRAAFALCSFNTTTHFAGKSWNWHEFTSFNNMNCVIDANDLNYIYLFHSNTVNLTERSLGCSKHYSINQLLYLDR